MCYSFSISSCPVEAVTIWVQILQGRGPGKCLVQSYGGVKFCSTVMTFGIFMKEYENCQIVKLKNLAQKINLQSVSDIKIHPGPIGGDCS